MALLDLDSVQQYWLAKEDEPTGTIVPYAFVWNVMSVPHRGFLTDTLNLLKSLWLGK